METTMEMNLQDANDILNSDWRLRLPIVRRRARQLLPYIVDNAVHWKPTMSAPPGKVERGYWAGVAEYAMDRHRREYPKEHKFGFAFPWLWLIGVLIQLVWKWWIERERQREPA